MSLQAHFYRLFLRWYKYTTNVHAPAHVFRAKMEQSAFLAKMPTNVAVRKVDADGVPCEWLEPANADNENVVFYLHGGAFLAGSPNTHRAMVARIAQASHACALLVDYRLAPEHPYPAAHEDSLAAYRWLLRNGTAPHNIIIAGDSAGVGLAVSTMVTLRDEGAPLPTAAVFISPFVDMEGTGESLVTRAKADPYLKPEQKTLLAFYFGEHDRRDPCISPLYADLRGLPPMLLHVGNDEILLSDATRLAERARSNGVNVTLDIWQGMWHVWHFFAPGLPEAVQAIEKLGTFARAQLEREVVNAL